MHITKNLCGTPTFVPYPIPSVCFTGCIPTKTPEVYNQLSGNESSFMSIPLQVLNTNSFCLADTPKREEHSTVPLRNTGEEVKDGPSVDRVRHGRTVT